MEKISERLPDFKTFEKTSFTILCRIGQELIKEYLEDYDRRILASRDTKEYRFINFGTTTVKTVMGEVTYTRRRYKKSSGGCVFLLDEAMEIRSGCGLVSENLAEQMVVECSEKPFRQAATTISQLTGQSVSAMGVWNILQQYGENVEAQEERLRALDQGGTTGQLGNVASPVLFQEMDDVWLPMQKEKRRKAGMPAVAGTKRTGKKPMHVATAYTGWKQEKDGRYTTEDKLAYASFGEVKEFVSDFEMLLRQRFDLDGVQRRVASGDGASWIRAAAEDSDAIVQLDSFHRNQAVMRAVNNPEDRKAVFGAIREKDINKVMDVIGVMIGEARDDDSREKLSKLFGYFKDNKAYLLTWQERGITLPTPPEGIVYRNLGVQEASNGNLLTHRLKHRKGSWSIQGATHMAKILSFRHTIGLDAMLGALPEPQAAEALRGPLSAAKAPQHDGKGYGGEWLHAGMPFDQSFLTHGRQAIRERVSQRALSDLAYR